MSPRSQHRLADLRLHVCPLHARGIDPVDAREHVEQAIGGVHRRSAPFAPHEVCRLLDAGLLQRDQAERRLVVDQEYGDQLASRVLGVELDHGAEIAEADIVGAARNLGDGVGAAATGIEGREVDLLCAVIAALAAEHEGRLLTLQQEVQDEPDVGGLRARGCDAGQGRQQQDAGCDDRVAYAHGCSSCSVGHRSLEPGISAAVAPAAMQAEIKEIAFAGRRSFAVQRMDYRARCGSRAGLISGVKSA